MSQPTVELQRGLEGWYDVTSRYYDDQTGLLEDHGGYGRNLEASGGPTLDVQAEASFKCGSFDGSDDEFRYNPSTTTLGTTTGATASILVKEDAAGTDGGILQVDGRFVLGFASPASGAIRAEARDDNRNFDSISFTKSPEKWKHLTVVWEEGEMRAYDGALVVSVNSSTFTSNQLDGGSSGIVLGSRFGSDFFSGDIAFAGVWNRVLTEAEIGQIARLTAPRRSIV